MIINIGNSSISIEAFTTYIHAVQLANHRAANCVERALIMGQLATAAMPADILGRITVFELAPVSVPLAHMLLKAIRDREAHVKRAESVVL